ncbi:hypothetical protein [Edwardsiella piscicida]|uniref:hypothetical protein n=1 Tax=Edwardsiella piscicida TaxID=1263550 RepID=UPI000D5110B0|nr:hypothetical protein [Edwardsiella piscicida]UCQ43001.1 hypothetical protein DCF39_09345 [Edwardsiella piscicida]
MAEILTLLGAAIVAFGIFVFWTAMMSFITWENPFRILKPIFFLRVFVAMLFFALLIYFIPGGK